MTDPASRSYCIVGLQGAGKGVVSSYLQRLCPAHHVIRSGPLWDEIAGRKLTHYERTVFQKEVVAEKGENYFVGFMMGKIRGAREQDPRAQFIVEGIRSREVFDSLRSYFDGGMLFIGVTADREVRYGRLGQRDGEHDIEDRERRDDAQFDLKSLVEMCDVRLENNYRDRGPLFKAVDRLLEGPA